MRKEYLKPFIDISILEEGEDAILASSWVEGDDVGENDPY